MSATLDTSHWADADLALISTRERYPANSIGRALSWATSELAVVSDTCRLEAEVLLSHVLDVPRATLLAHPEHQPAREALSLYRRLVRRRCSGYPLPYLTGQMAFYGLTFEVTADVLIPRPETELLVDLALSSTPTTVVDVGTGSGCIAIALAICLPQVRVVGIDIAPAALAVARRNAERHAVGERISFMAGDVLVPRPGPADMIISNPPYVRTGDCGALPVSVRDHEPRLALDGGPDGLDIVRRLLGQAPGVLQSGGRMLIEIGADQGASARHLAQTYFPAAEVRVHPDLAGHDRVLDVQLAQTPTAEG